MGSRMCSGPVEQFSPITSMGKPFQDGQHRGDIRSQQHSPGGIQGHLCLDGQIIPVSWNACWIPWMAAFTSRISCEVSIRSRSTPPAINPAACSRKTSISSSTLTLESSGSFIEGSLPEGPIDPATKRGCSGVVNSSASFPGERGCCAIDLHHPVSKTIFCQGDAVGAEGAGLDNIHSDLEEGAMHCFDRLGVS